MEIRESATYPYPIWGIHDSFIGDRPVPGKRELVSNNETNTLDVKYEVLAHNIGVDRLIDEGKAAYKYIVECPQTYYLKHEEFQTGQFVICIPYDKVFNRVSIKVVVVATTDISGAITSKLMKYTKDQLTILKVRSLHILTSSQFLFSRGITPPTLVRLLQLCQLM